MVGVLVATHGELAAALLSTLGMILGETEGVEAVTLDASDTLETLSAKLEAARSRVDPGNEGTLVLVDMLGGTPFNCGVQMALSRNVRVITGVNLPMLFKVISHRDEKDLDHLAQEVQVSARESILTSIELMKRSQG